MIEGFLGHLALLQQLANLHRATGIAQHLQNLLLQVVSGRKTEKSRVKLSSQGRPASKLQGQERSPKRAQSREGARDLGQADSIKDNTQDETRASVRWTLAPQLDVWMANGKVVFSLPCVLRGTQVVLR